MTVNQWVPAAHDGDAIGDSARRVRDLLRVMGHRSDIFALTIDEDLANEIRPFDDPASRTGDVTIFHFALPSRMTPVFATLTGLRVLQYHNITPAHFFAPYDADICRLAGLGRDDLRTLVGKSDIALGDSEFNRRELEDLGFDNTGVFPIAIDTSRIAAAPRRPALEAALDDGRVNFLFVGRIVPNKRIEDHIRLAQHYRRYVDPDYRFIFVGRTEGLPHYYSMLRALMAQYDLPADRVCFTGPVDGADLATYYRMARVYVSMSEHEGFCVPLLEAMSADVPVLAYASTAVPDTLGGAGVLFSPKDMEMTAELLATLAYDTRVRRDVIDGQRRRLEDFGEARTRHAIEALLAGRPLNPAPGMRREAPGTASETPS